MLCCEGLTNMITIIFSISNLLCKYDQRSQLSSVSMISDYDSNPWSWLSSVSVLSLVDMILSSVSIITNHDYL